MNCNKSWRAKCLFAGLKKELAYKRKFYRKLKEKNIKILAEFNYLENASKNNSQNDNQSCEGDCDKQEEDEEEEEERLSSDDLELRLREHQEKFFKRKQLCIMIIENEFMKNRHEYAQF